MPELNSIGATQAIREHEQASGSCPEPVVAMTANSEKDLPEERREAGMAGFLGEPFLSSDLRQCLATRCHLDSTDTTPGL